jgi:hypothetical protein
MWNVGVVQAHLARNVQQLQPGRAVDRHAVLLAIDLAGTLSSPGASTSATPACGLADFTR